MTPKSEIEQLKHQLEVESAELEKDIKTEFSEFRTLARKRVRQSLLIGGGAILAISLFKALLSDKKKIPKNGKIIMGEQSTLFTSRIKTALLTILLEFAKKKLIDYLNQVTDDTESDKDTPVNR